MQAIDPKHRNARIFERTRRRFGQYDARTALYRPRDEFDAVPARTMQRKERIAGTHVT
jgi:hypothetical protein